MVDVNAAVGGWLAGAAAAKWAATRAGLSSLMYTATSSIRPSK